jgi:hypothetical protein
MISNITVTFTYKSQNVHVTFTYIERWDVCYDDANIIKMGWTIIL